MTAHPIARLSADSFGTFSKIDVKFAPGLNVIVGENSAGKSQLLKLLYSATAVLSERDRLSPSEPRRTSTNTSLAAKLVGVFRPESLGRLVNRRRGRNRCEVSVDFKRMESALTFDFASSARTEVKVSSVPRGWIEDTPVYFPTRELLSIYPGFASLYDERELEFEETWRDTATLLGRPSLRGPREARAAGILAPIEEAMGGTIAEENGRFYLRQPGVGTFEMHLVAEGLRKLGMLVRLVTSGTLLTSGYLFWDEPEANLNPRTLRHVARTVIELSRAGVQVFVATHSMFLLREFEILLSSDNEGPRVPTQFIGLSRASGGIEVHSGPSTADLGDITALDEELNQSDRYFRHVS
ncbi:ATP/GTP-binding protein [Cellulomonas sp. GbtcB1]|uniref:AAA family ATPase n=1 Tax=Cellulomonas sp. GbtcB1 TaxID=2824746 RepID=UPI001C30C791|nr:AAA family ATPase [Cellulomonas sp. GbtcB1]